MKLLPVLFAALFTTLLSAADVTGKWSGTFTVEQGDSRSAYIVLEEKAGKITGQAGPSADELHSLSNCKLTGDELSCEVEAGEAEMKFKVTINGDAMEGTLYRSGNGQNQTAKLALKRVRST